MSMLNTVVEADNQLRKYSSLGSLIIRTEVKNFLKSKVEVRSEIKIVSIQKSAEIETTDS